MKTRGELPHLYHPKPTMQTRQINAHLVAGGGGGGFDLLPYSPSLWLNDTGSDASEWVDQSGNGNDVTQATGTRQPSIVSAVVNGKQVRRFDGNDDKLAVASSIDITGGMFFMVVKQNSLKNYGVFFAANGTQGLHSSSTNVYGYGTTFNNCRINGDSGSEFSLGSGGNIFSAWCLFTAVVSSASTLYFDYLGYDGSHCFDGDLAMFAAFTSANLPDSTERAAIEAGLVAEYGF